MTTVQKLDQQLRRAGRADLADRLRSLAAAGDVQPSSETALLARKLLSSRLLELLAAGKTLPSTTARQLKQQFDNLVQQFEQDVGRGWFR